ncbi:hypothetical protein B5X24_HaOG209601 [Helicoverpa armigera]|nr:hypothetical protein B5X24_HaOG209601 [Helicoverpa armigera]
MDVMDEESLVAVSASAFSEEDIKAAKLLLFEAVAQRNVVRKGEKKSNRNLYDILTLLKETDPEKVPIFVARDLQKLPPVTFNHIDVTRLLKDIVIIQKELREIQERCLTNVQYATMDDVKSLREEIEKLKSDTTKVSNSDPYVNNKRGGYCLQDSFECNSGPMGFMHMNSTKNSKESPTLQENNCSNQPQTDFLSTSYASKAGGRPIMFRDLDSLGARTETGLVPGVPSTSKSAVALTNEDESLRAAQETTQDRPFMSHVHSVNLQETQTMHLGVEEQINKNQDNEALQETWLLPHDLSYLSDIHGDYAAAGVSAVDTAEGVIRGRPFGGVALLWRKNLFSAVEVIKCNSARVCAIKCVNQYQSLLIFSVYMPTDCQENLPQFTACLSEINAIVDDCNIDLVYVMGDFNAHPVSVGNVMGNENIANMFKDMFSITPMTCDTSLLTKPVSEPGKMYARFTATNVRTAIKKMQSGKTPGHDGLSIEHMRYAGVHLPRVLSMLFNFCIGHSYVPNDMTKTVVIPIIKNKNGDPSDKNNYRPISLATTFAKVLDSLINMRLNEHLSIQESQFGFRPDLSTESAILCAKQTIRYYTDRKTPVYACFLDLSIAFDLVSYDVLWHKLIVETNLPNELVILLKYWYHNQINMIRWENAYSQSYNLKCGVRQGGLSSPSLFNLFVNQLIGELNGTMIGCSIDGKMINNISYADDMVLLSPSVGALRRLLAICETYAQTHGLKYNASKSVFMLCKAGKKTPLNVPPIKLCGVQLNRVNKFKYLGHILTDDLRDDEDLERERRALAVRCNMVARRFARCTAEIKQLLFKTFCQSFYTCSLWINFTRRAYNALRVQYNDALRILLRKPRYCSASAMFADAGIDDFFAIIRKRTASMMTRLCGSTNSILRILADKIDSPFRIHWAGVHINGNKK